MSRDPETLAHVEWLGYVQPVGLVVSIPALLAAQAHVNRHILPDHQRFVALLPRDRDDEPEPRLTDLATFTQQVLGWRADDLEPVVPNDPQFSGLEVPLPEYHETLRPTHVVREHAPRDPAHPWLMLVQVLPPGTPLDEVVAVDSRRWQATPHARFERLLRESQVPIGLLVNEGALWLVYAPRGESSGYLTFSVAEMAQVAGRPIFAALHMLLCADRLFSLGEKQRLPAILADSRRYQNHVSTELAQQVLSALYELLRGFQAAHAASRDELLRDVLAHDPQHVYHGLLTVLMRLVFLLYAEDRGLISSDPVYANYYSVTGLFERLRGDAGRFPDTLDQRFGAWAQLLTLFRLVYDGGSHGDLAIPPRRGYLFDPDRYNFLEGRGWQTTRDGAEGPIAVPRVADGVIYRVLSNLLILDGERLSYRSLDVEQIGSVYETMMGFGIELAQGRSIAIKPKKKHGAPTTINLDALLEVKPGERNKWLKGQADRELSGKAAAALKEATTVEQLLAALEGQLARTVTPHVVPAGSMVFQPSDERRRSGSHYTPRSLTEPIVRTTLRPVLEQLGPNPTPEQILGLKVCDPAMGSGAFLVEVCRQLGDQLVQAWRTHRCLPALPPDEDELLHARRLVAQRCLYGVDKNPMAVDLSKLSLWLATLAKDHPFTFLDHALRAGDSLVGLSREQIAAFHWQPTQQQHLLETELAGQIGRATEARRKIIAAPEETPYADQQQAMAVAEEALDRVRRLGDLVIAAFFAADKPKEREQRRKEYLDLVVRVRSPQARVEDVATWIRHLASLHTGPHPVTPFHWEIEFPEVFTVDAKGTMNGGFDAILGNPPFMTGTSISTTFGMSFRDWLNSSTPMSSGNADLAAHFFRRAFTSLRTGGCFGLIATNTISQGETRCTGLQWICANGGVIYNARKRYQWPGPAAVIISVIHVIKGAFIGTCLLDERSVAVITPFLFHTGPFEDARPLSANKGISFKGSELYGMGFTFDDTDQTGASNPIALMHQLINKNPRNRNFIYPYIGGEEINESPTHSPVRFAIGFGELSQQDAQTASDLMEVIVRKVKPQRDALPDNPSARSRKEKWWQWSRPTSELYRAIRPLVRTLACARHQPHWCVAVMPTSVIFSDALVVFSFESHAGLCGLQSRPHEVWARFFASSMKDDLRYTPSDCFETFPFPPNLEANAALETAGQEYYEFRAALMIRNNEGLTKTYNRFHDREERSPDILRLRDLHAAMDRTVLEAYGWHDLAATASCDFLLDYEDDDEEPEDDGPPTRARTRKKPWRYRWPDDFRDEVLARLLALNAERAEQERLAGETAAAKPAQKPKRAGKKKAGPDQPTLF